MRALLFVLVVAAPPAGAGAWPRGEGQSFVSLRYAATADRTAIEASVAGLGTLDALTRSTLYAEHGLTPQFTVGVDFTMSHEAEIWTGLMFLRRSFAFGGPNVWAVEIAAGQRTLFDDEVERILRPSLQWGRGAAWGWLSAEAYAEMRSESDQPAWKLDTTAGWNQSDSASWVAQVQTAAYPGADITVRLAPSYVRRLSERMRVELGVLADLTGREDVGVTLGTWLDF